MKFECVIIFSSDFGTRHGSCTSMFSFVNLHSWFSWHASRFVSLQNFAPFSVIIRTCTGAANQVREWYINWYQWRFFDNYSMFVKRVFEVRNFETNTKECVMLVCNLGPIQFSAFCMLPMSKTIKSLNLKHIQKVAHACMQTVSYQVFWATEWAWGWVHICRESNQILIVITLFWWI